MNNHKGERQLKNTYHKAGWMNPKVLANIKRVILDCKICQKFVKSESRPLVTLPMSTIFNGVVTLDLKVFGLKHVLWIIESFNRFVQGKVILNKRTETIVKVVMVFWDTYSLILCRYWR